MRENIYKNNWYPLSSSQMNIWNLEQAFKGTPMNNICETIRIRGTFDAETAARCLNLVLESDSSLRTRIFLDADKTPVQYETAYAPEQFPVLDFSLTNQEGMRRWEKSITREVMPVLDAPLYQFIIIRIGEHEGEILVKTHHLISDGWSQVALINKIAVTYLDLLEGKEVHLESAPSYRLHVEAEQKYLTSKLYEKDMAYWRELLKNVPQPVSLKDYHSADISPVGHRKTFYLSEVLNHAMTAFCTGHRVAPFAVFYMAVAIYLKRTKGVERFCMGAPVHNRSTQSDRKTTGMFVSTLPFFSELDESWSFEEFNGYLTDQWLDLLRHQKISYAKIAAISREENPDVNQLYHLVLSFHNSQAYKNHNTQVTFLGQWQYSGYQAEHICIHLNNIEDEKRYSVNYDYLTQLFSEEEIENFHNYIVNILNQALTWPERPIRELSFLGPAEEEKVLYGFNRTERFVRPASIGQKLREICRKYPTRAAVIEDHQRYTYDMLWENAQAVAQVILANKNAAAAPASDAQGVSAAAPAADFSAALANAGTAGDGIVALMLPRSFWLLAAMAGTALAGKAWVLLPEGLPSVRISEIVEDCHPELFVGTGSALADIASAYPKMPVLDIDTFIKRTDLPIADSGEICLGGPDSLAYMIYTSGSTGKPKGVEIEQRSLLNFAESMSAYYGTGAVLSLCNIGFDAFLIESIVPLLCGQTIVLAGASDVEDPAALGRLIRSFAVGFLTTTPSRLSAYMKNRSFLDAASRLEVILCGGENFPGSLLTLLNRHTGAKIYNQYGPSETTVGVTIGLLNKTACISAGRPMPNCRCYVLDKYGNPLPVGVYGELYIAGICVGRGYHGNAALTAQSFLSNPFEPGERMYRSGDIAAWTNTGELLIKGRADGQVKVRGQRLELGEVSVKLMRHPMIGEAVVRLLDLQGSQVLAAYYTADAKLPSSKLYEFASSILPDYMVPAVYMHVASIPLTANGKVDIAKLPLPELTQASGSGGPMAAGILEVFRKVLKAPEMPLDGDYFLYGGDSLNALETLTDLEELFGIRLKVADLYAFRTAARMEQRLGGGEMEQCCGGGETEWCYGDGVTELCVDRSGFTKAPDLKYYPLTAPQMGIYFETMLHPEEHSYNMPCAFRLGGPLDFERMEAAYRRLVEIEPALRLGFEQTGEGIRQKLWAFAEILDGFTGEFVERFNEVSFEDAREAFVRPFDLSRPPLMRIGLWEDTAGCIVMMDMHHIVGDGETAAMLLERLNKLYIGQEPEGCELSFVDYAYWQSGREAQAVEAERPYWEEQLASMPELPQIPTDFERSHQTDMTGAVVEFSLTEGESGICDSFCEAHGYTPYMLFTAAFGLLVSRISGSSGFFTGVPVSGRRSRSLETMAGLFVNTLPLRLQLDTADLAGTYMERVKSAVIGLIDHAAMPLERLVEMSGVRTPGGENTFYNTLVSMRPMLLDGAEFAGYRVLSETMPGIRAKVDLNLEIYRMDHRWHFRLEYPAGLFRTMTAQFYGRSLCTAAVSLAKNMDRPLDDIVTVSAQDWFYLAGQTENAVAAFADVPIDRLVDMAAVIAPDRPALIFRGETMTMGALKSASDALALRLRGAGVKQRDHVGILSLRGPQLMIAMMAVLKLGCAYVPMLPSFPAKRLQSMMEIGGVALTLCDSRTMQALPEGLSCWFMDIGGEDGSAAEPTACGFAGGTSAGAATGATPCGAAGGTFAGAATGPDVCGSSATARAAEFVPVEGRSGDDVCFILFTSGSTGEPKGVMIRHRSISNLYSVMYPILSPAQGGCLCLANSIFDIFITETLLSAAMGNYTVMADEDEMVLPWRCAALIRKHNVRILEFTPSRAALFVENEDFYQCLDKMPVMLMCGEVFPPPLLEKIRKGGCQRIFNLYGPTEVTVYCTMDDVTCADKITVGRIFPNCRAYVLDERRKRVMPTARGELYFGGECVSAGYVGREDLTKELFVPDPFLPGQTLYRSGDIVRLLPDGRLDFVGRADHQVKLNGQRVELAEISRKMISSGLVGQAAVVVVPDGEFKALRGFVTPVSSGDSETKEGAGDAGVPMQADSVSMEERAGDAGAPMQADSVSVEARASGADASICSGSVDMKALRCYLESELPPYMVPPEIIVLDALPVTASGKTDLKRLEAWKAPEIVADSGTSALGLSDGNSSGFVVEPVTPMAVVQSVSTIQPKATAMSAEPAQPTVTFADLEKMWDEVLPGKAIDMEASFFEQGGTSLTALNLLSRYYNRGLSMTLAQFYGNPTLKGQIEFFCGSLESTENPAAQAAQPEVVQASPVEVTQTSPAETAQTVSPVVPQATPQKRAVLLTGATGFLGAHILKELMDRGYEKVYCIVRGQDDGRLRDTLGWYFGRGFVTSVKRRICAVCGDILQEDFGIEPLVKEKLKGEVGLVIHAAADVRHYAAGDGAFRTNRDGTWHAANFAVASGARLVYISTVSLGSEYIRAYPEMPRSFNEDDFDIGQNWSDNVYLKGKFEGERIVRQIAGSGHPVMILRVGRLVGRSSDGVFQKNPASNAFWGLVSGIIQLGFVSRELADMPMDTTAVDECASAAVSLIENGTQLVYHLYNPQMLTVREMIAGLGLDVREVSQEEFEASLRSHTRFGGSTELNMLLNQYQRFMQVPVRIAPECTQTVDCLARLGFSWKAPKIDRLLMGFIPEEK